MITPPGTWPAIVWSWWGITAAFVGLVLWSRRRTAPGASALCNLAFANAIYVGTSALELVTVDLRLWYWISGLQYLGAGLLSVFLYILFADISGCNAALTRPCRRLLVVAGFVLGAARFADPWLGLVVRNVAIARTDGLVLHQFDLGPFFVLLQIVMIAALAGGYVLVARTWREASPLLRRHMAVLALSCLLPIALNLLSLFGLSPWPGVDPTPAGSLAAFSLTTWAIFRDRLARVAPIARNRLMEQMADGVLVVDTLRAVVDFNPAARRLLQLDPGSTLGRPLAQALARWPAVAAVCAGEQEQRDEICPAPAAEVYWQITWSPLAALRTPGPQGFILVVADITARKHAEHQLHALLATRTRDWQLATATALRASEEEQLRLGHLVHDTLCQDLVGFRRTAELLAGQLPPMEAVRLLALGESIAETGRRARDLAHLLAGPDLLHQTFNDALQATAGQLERSLGLDCEVTIHPEFPPPGIENGRHLLRIVREAVVNAARHAAARRVWVDLLANRDGGIVVTITNDGHPPPPPAAWQDGLGWRQMRMRAALLGGTIGLAPGPDGGAVVELRLPPPPPAAA